LNLDSVGKTNKLIKIKVLLRCDAGTVSDIGTGHVIRTLRLGEELKSKNWFKKSEIIIMYRNDSSYNLAKPIIDNYKKKFKTLEFKKYTSNTELALILKTNPNIIIFDTLKAPVYLLKKLKKYNKLLLGFDIKGPSAKYFDYLVYSLIDPPFIKKNLYKGYKYLNLSKNIITINYHNKKVENIFVSLGWK